jgi:general stress protein 26
MEALWPKWVEVFFPKGIDDPDLVLLRVDIEKAEYWDAVRSDFRRVC